MVIDLVIKPSRGLRQSDPLSPFLYLICAEGLSHLIRTSPLEGIAISRQGPKIKHLVFADDSIIYTKADMVQARYIRTILHIYAKASGQTINLAKSSLFFSHNTPTQVKGDIASWLGVHNVGGQDKFLGLPAAITRSKSQSFAEIRDQI